MLRNLNYTPAAGRRILGTPKVGVLGAAIPSGGQHGASFIYPSLSLPADAGKYYSGRVLTLPASGVLTTFENGAFEYDPQGSIGEQAFTVQLFENGAALGSPITVTLELTTTATVTSVSVSPATASVAGAAQRQFAATVTGTNSPPQSVTWSASTGTITAGGLFSAPAATSSDQLITITATSVLDGTKSGAALVTVPAVVISTPTVSAVTVSPTVANVQGGAQQQFAASVAGTNSPSQAVTWSASTGSISAGGLFSAPAATSSDQLITITATSVLDGTKSGSALVTIPAVVISTPTVSAVTVSPAVATLQGNAQQQFSATVFGANSPSQSVTWSASTGTITAGGLFSAPAATSSDLLITITATSVLDGTKSGSALVTVPAAVVTPSSTEPVTLAQAKAHLRIDPDVTGDDPLIANLITAARQQAEHRTGRQFGIRERTKALPRFGAQIRLPAPPLRAVVRIDYDDPDGAEHTLDPALYRVRSAVEPGVIMPVADWPQTYDAPDAVRITYVCGLDATNLYWESLRAWMLLAIGTWYQQREAGTPVQTYALPHGFWDGLLDPLVFYGVTTT